MMPAFFMRNFFKTHIVFSPQAVHAPDQFFIP